MALNRSLDYESVAHPFGPVYDSRSKILILGSFPSVKSREQNFYYGHPMNRFWKVLARIYNESSPKTIDDKRKLCLEHHIALYDAIGSCDIRGSSDVSIKNVVPTDIKAILDESSIQLIVLNGKKSYETFCKYQLANIPPDIRVVCLPSTSPANAACSFDELLNIWGSALSSL